MINVIKDTDLYEHFNEYDFILIGTGINCMMTQGIQRDIMLNYPYVQNENMKTKYGDKSKLGTILECKEEGQPTFILLFIYTANQRPDLNPVYVSYESIEKCLKIVNILYKGSKVATTMLGCSRFDGNGEKNTVLELLKKYSTNINLDVYDYEQKSRAEKLKEMHQNELKLKEENIDAYYEAVRKRKEEAERRKENNGHARY